MHSTSLKVWGVGSAMLCAYGASLLAVVASAHLFAETQQARVITCGTRLVERAGGYPHGPI